LLHLTLLVLFCLSNYVRQHLFKTLFFHQNLKIQALKKEFLTFNTHKFYPTQCF
jgi:hypothetical protein